MELSQALDRISEIHGHLAKSEVYRGYRPVPVALSGVAALAAAALERHLVPASAPETAARYWLAVAAACGVACAAEIVRGYVREDAFARRTTRHVLGQFVPCLVAGAAVTAAALRAAPAPALAPLLPGLWAILFGLGIFASRPYLPRATGWVSVFYVAAGTLLLWDAAGALTSPWGMGLTFGVGQLLAAFVLWRNLERSRDV